MKNLFYRKYEQAIFNYALPIILAVVICIAFLAIFIKDFRLDASSDALVLENDQSLKYYRQIKSKYGSDNYLIITFSPKDDLFSSNVIDNLSRLREQLASLNSIESVTSILDVPLIKSPQISLKDLQNEIPTIANGKVDISLAGDELIRSPIYSNLLISKDAKTTAILLKFKSDKKLDAILEGLSALKASKADLEYIDKAKLELKEFRASLQDKRQSDITQIRQIIEPFKEAAKIHLGGVPMITVDSIEFVRNDLKIFGLAVICFIVLLLWLIFRNVIWVIFPVLTCLFSGVAMVGLLGLVGWNITIVSSNFISLLLIITLSLTVHLIVRYREIHFSRPKLGQRDIIKNTMRQMIVPCLYTALTTIVAFGSLVVSGIRPVIDFGFMMMIGVFTSFVIAFTFFPAALSLLSPSKEFKYFDFTKKITCFFADLIEHHNRKILVVYLAIAIFSVVGISKLSVENRFIDYYKKSTEIYKGMKVIDQNLGGTTPLDIIIDAPKDYLESEENKRSDKITNGFWFNGFLLEDIASIHKFLDELPETGKVLSFHTTIEMLKAIDDRSTIDSFYLSVLYQKVPDIVRNMLFKPYISADGNQLRFSVRVFESDASLKRDKLLSKIENHLVSKMGFKPEEATATGMLVLYNNLLKSLFESQILTVGFVFLVILAMFILSFKNITLAIIAIIPNILAASLILGVMGWLSIPLDIMTITIAAICIGIAVDNTIHYIHRFKTEFRKSRDYWISVRMAHSTIGRAMYYTTITVAFGFSILAFSNFIPTIYFGLLTGFALIMALLANLTLLPTFLILLKPMKKRAKNNINFS